MKHKEIFIILTVIIIICGILFILGKYGAFNIKEDGIFGQLGILTEQGTKEYYDLIPEKLEQNTVLKDNKNVVFSGISFYLSPFSSEEEIKELAEVLYDVSCDEDLYRGHANVGVFCYSHAIGIDLLKNPSKSWIEEVIADFVSLQNHYAKNAYSKFYNEIEKFDALHIADSGEWYFVLREDEFDSDFSEMSKALDEICELNPIADQEHGRYSYDYYRKSDTHEPEYIYAGFTGDSVSIYRNSYSPENKVSERLLLESRLIYEDIFRTFIYDYKPIKPDLAEIYYSAYIWEENGELNMQITWDEWEEYLSMEKLIDHTYTLYDEITSAASSNNCYKLGKISINACSPHEYNVERDEVRVELYFPNKSTHPIKYDKEKWTEELRKHLTRDVEMEPV